MKGFVRGLSALLALVALSAHAQDKARLVTERDKVSYMVGMDIAESNAPIGPDVDIPSFERALRNAMAGKPPLIDEATARKTGEQLMARIGARNQPNAKLPDISKVDVGLLVGVEPGRRLAPIQDEIDIPVLVQAVRTAFSGGKLLMTADEANIVRQDFSTKLNAAAVARAQAGATDNQKQGAEFLAKNKLQKGVFTTKSGLQYQILRQGSGPRPKPGDRVHIVRPHPERPGVVWAEDGMMSAGWVPVAVLDAASGSARARTEYCSQEVAVQPGDTVHLLWEGNGAWWCENRDGDRGWLQADALQIGSASSGEPD